MNSKQRFSTAPGAAESMPPFKILEWQIVDRRERDALGWRTLVDRLPEPSRTCETL